MAQYTAIPTRLNTLKVATGGSEGAETYTQISGLTNIQLTFGNEKEQYYTYDSVWQDTNVLGKSMQITFEGKRYKDDPAQNKLVATADKAGDEACVKCQYSSASDGTYEGLFAVELTEFAGGGDPNTTGFIKGTLYLKGEPKHTALGV